MNKPVSRFIGFLVLLGIAVGMGSFWVYNLGEFNCKFTAQEHFKTKDGLKTITVNSKEFAAMGNKDEVNINGALYDVYGYSVTGDSVVITVWHDEQEETIQSELVSLFESQQQISNTTGSSQLAKYHPYFPDVKIMPGEAFRLSFVSVSPAPKYDLQKDCALTIFSPVDIIKPPPDNC